MSRLAGLNGEVLLSAISANSMATSHARHGSPLQHSDPHSCPPPRKNARSAGTCSSICSTQFMKHVLPRLLSPRSVSRGASSTSSGPAAPDSSAAQTAPKEPQLRPENSIAGTSPEPSARRGLREAARTRRCRRSCYLLPKRPTLLFCMCLCNSAPAPSSAAAAVPPRRFGRFAAISGGI
eukprot:351732-Chlamydomonas_euryale.AAC.4